MAGAAGAAGAFLAERSGVASGALTKCGSNLGWALLPRAGAFCSRRGRLLLLLLERRSLLRPPEVRLGSSMVRSSFSSFTGCFACALGTAAAFFSGFAGAAAFAGFACCSGCFPACSGAALGFLPRTGGSGRTGAGTPSHGWPDTTGIFRRFSFSMPARYSCSSGAQKLTAVPSAPARAVRPMRCT